MYVCKNIFSSPHSLENLLHMEGDWKKGRELEDDRGERVRNKEEEEHGVKI
jgi:hypothetical protein